MNEDGVVDEKDKTILGNPNPDFTYGLDVYKRQVWNRLIIWSS